MYTKDEGGGKAVTMTTLSSAYPSPFWYQDPMVLCQKLYIFDWVPTESMNYNEKLNALSRLVIVLTSVAFVFQPSLRLLLIGLVTLVVIVWLHGRRRIMQEGLEASSSSSSSSSSDAAVAGTETGETEESSSGPVPANTKMDMDKKKEKRKKKGGALPPAPSPYTYTDPETLETFLKSEFQSGTAKNPFSNVLLTDIGDTPQRKAAPPSFHPEVDNTIVRDTKSMVQEVNPGIDNTNKQLFSSLTDQFDLDQSSRAFYSTANTRVANDQGAFGQFLYGNMPSAKESNAEGNMQRVADAYRYTLY
jgi:hypothetical protein